MNKNVFVRLVALALLMLGLSSQSYAAVTWDFTAVTEEIGGMGTAILALTGTVVAAGIVLFGTKHAIRFVKAIWNRISA